jgi:hypothetical protein
MKPLLLRAAVFGVLALASAKAGASTDSSSFRVSLTIAAPCEVTTLDAAAGGQAVAVHCQSAATPYRLEQGAAALGPQVQDARMDESDGHARMTLTF